MFPRKKSSSPHKSVIAEPLHVVVIRRPVHETLVDDNGLIKTIVVPKVFTDFDDLTTNFRAYSVQTLLKVEAVDLLKPLGSIPSSRLSAVDALGQIDVSLENLGSTIERLKSMISESNEPKTE